MEVSYEDEDFKSSASSKKIKSAFASQNDGPAQEATTVRKLGNLAKKTSASQSKLVIPKTKSSKSKSCKNQG